MAIPSSGTLNLEHEFAEGFMVEVAYAGSHGVHLPNGTQTLNQLPLQYMSLGTDLQTQVKNPFYGLISQGTLASATVAKGQLLRPYPQYTGFGMVAPTNGNSIYHSLQVKVEKRFRTGGTFLLAYTNAKLISDTENLASWTESTFGARSIQHPECLSTVAAEDRYRRETSRNGLWPVMCLICRSARAKDGWVG